MTEWLAVKYVIVVFALSLISAAQSSHKISDGFARSALKAVAAIEGDGSLPELRDDEVYGSRHTLDAINEADSQAQSKSESSIVDMLTRLYSEKLINNVQRQQIELNHQLEDRESVGEIARKMKLDDAMAHDPELKAIRSRESGCFSTLITSLRSRLAVFPKACASIIKQ